MWSETYAAETAHTYTSMGVHTKNSVVANETLETFSVPLALEFL